jgi:hypothetical protein
MSLVVVCDDDEVVDICMHQAENLRRIVLIMHWTYATEFGFIHNDEV